LRVKKHVHYFRIIIEVKIKWRKAIHTYIPWSLLCSVGCEKELISMEAFIRKLERRVSQHSTNANHQRETSKWGFGLRVLW
jgi:hypothetical protein